MANNLLPHLTKKPDGSSTEGRNLLPEYLKKPIGIGETAGRIGKQIYNAAVYDAPAALAASIEGDQPFAENDWKDRLILRARKRWQETSGTAERGTAIPGVSTKDIEQLGPSLGFSAIGSGAGLAAGALAMPAAAVTAGVAPYAAGGAASFAAANRMSKNQFVRDLYDAENEKIIQETGAPITPEAFAEKQKSQQDAINSYGLWEAVPEAASNVAGFGILKAPIKGAVGKIFGKNLLTRLGSKAASLYGTELVTETATQMGQQRAESSAGMTPESPRQFTKPADWAKSFREVAAPVALQTTLMGGAAKGAMMLNDARTRRAAGPQNEPSPAEPLGLQSPEQFARNWATLPDGQIVPSDQWVGAPDGTVSRPGEIEAMAAQAEAAGRPEEATQIRARSMGLGEQQAAPGPVTRAMLALPSPRIPAEQALEVSPRGVVARPGEMDQALAQTDDTAERARILGLGAQPAGQTTATAPVGQPSLILRTDGAPFKTEQSARTAITNRRLANHQIVPVEGGFAIAPQVSASLTPMQETQNAQAVRGDQSESAGPAPAAEGGRIPSGGDLQFRQEAGLKAGDGQAQGVAPDEVALSGRRQNMAERQQSGLRVRGGRPPNLVNLPSQPSPAAPRGRRLQPFTDNRLSDPEARSTLQAMSSSAGWAEIGGLMTRDSEGNVGRTKWVPRADWFGDIQADKGSKLTGNLKGVATRVAVQKALSGEPMTEAQKRHVIAMLEWKSQEQLDYEAQHTGSIDPFTLLMAADDVGIDHGESLSDEALAARALEIDEEAVNRAMAASEYESEFLDEMRRIVDGEAQRQGEDQAVGGGSESVPGVEAAPASQEGFSLTGETEAQRVAEEARKKAEKAAQDKADAKAEEIAMADREAKNFELGAPTNQSDLQEQEVRQKADAAEAKAKAEEAAEKPAPSDTPQIKESSGSSEDSKNERNASAVQGYGGVARSVSEPDETGARQFDLFAEPGESKRQAYADLYGTVVKAKTVSYIKASVDHISSDSDLASLLASIRKDAQESLYAVVTDKGGKILRVMRHTKGLKAGSSVSPVTIISEAAGIPGASKIYMAHNHPSGNPRPSLDDVKITDFVERSLNGTGMSIGGHVVIGKSTWALVGGNSSFEFKPGLRTKSIPITERTMTKRDTLGEALVSPEITRRFVAGLDNAIVLLNQKHYPVGIVNMTADEMTNLRGNSGEGAKRILSALDKSNAYAMIVKTSDLPSARNITNFVRHFNESSEFKLLDWINGEGVSAAESGRLDFFETAPYFSGTKEGAAGSTITVDGVERPTTDSEGRPIHPTKEGIRNFWRGFAGSKTVDADGRPMALYHGTPGGGFDEFNDVSHFTENPAYASLYTNPSASSMGGKRKTADAPAVYRVYLSIKNPFDTRVKKNAELYKEFTNSYGNGTPLSDRGLPDWTDSYNLMEWIDETGQPFDGLILDEGGTPEGGHRGISWVPRRRTQVKSAMGNTGEYSQSDARIHKSAGEGQQGERTVASVTSSIEDKLGKGALAKIADHFMIVEDMAALRADMVKRGSKFVELVASKEDFLTKGIYDPSTDTSYIVAGNLKADDSPYGIFIHEVGEHYGLEKMLGPEAYRGVLNQAQMILRAGGKAMREAAVRVNASENVGLDPDAKNFHRLFADKMAGNKRLSREVIAYLADDPKNHDLPFVRRIMVAVREFMRKLGFTKPLTTDDIVSLIVTAARRSGEFATRRGEASTETIKFGGAARPTTNSKGQPIHPTEEGLRNFWRWFRDSKAVDDQGRPLTLYHGTRQNVSEFDPLRTGTASDAGWYGSGFYFTPDPDTASSYAANRDADSIGFGRMRDGSQDVGANVIPVYLRLRNPYDWHSEHSRGLLQNNAEASVRKRAELEALGHDGVVVFRDFIQIPEGGSLSDEQWGALTAASPMVGQLGRDTVTRLFQDREWTYRELEAAYGVDVAQAMLSSRSRRVLMEAVVFRPEQIKSATGNQGSYDPSDTDIRRSANAPEWYSQMSRVLATKLPNSGTAESMLRMIESYKEFKAEELDYSGIREFLAQQTGKVTKQEILDEMALNAVKVETVVLDDELDIPSARDLFDNEWPGGFSDWLYEGIKIEIDKAWGDEEHELWSYMPNTKEDYLAAYTDEDGDVDVDDARKEYEGDAWNLDPSDYYTAEEWESLEGEAFREFKGDYEQRAREIRDDAIIEAEANRGASTKFSAYQLSGPMTNYREVLLTLPNDGSTSRIEALREQYILAKGADAERIKVEIQKLKAEKPEFKSSHFDQPNIVAHLRMNDRVDADGRKTLFVEEVQSDYSIAVRKAAEEKAFLKDKLMPGTNEFKKRANELAKDPEALGLPKLPFQNSWTTLAMKKALRMAVDGGYDSLSWVTGEQTQDRYDLSKSISKIEYESVSDPADTYEIAAYDLSGKEVFREDEVNIGRVEELVGKDIAKKIEAGEGEPLKGQPYRNWRVLSGLDLKTGGEWAKNLYDERIPNELNKYVKKWGGRVGEATINGETQHSLTITPAIREGVSLGQPLFSRRATHAAMKGDRFNLPEETLAQAGQRKAQDATNYIGTVQKAVVEQGGTIDAASDMTLAIKKYPGLLAAKLKAMNETLLEPLMKRIHDAGTTPGEVALLAYAEHAPERNREIAKINKRFPNDGAPGNSGSGMTDADAAEIIRQASARPNAGKLFALSGELRKISDKNLDNMVAGGVMSQEQADAYRARYKNYVPLKGFELADEEGAPQGTGKGLSTGSKISMRALGRSSRAGDLFENTLHDYEVGLMLVEKARVARVVRNFVKANPDEKLWSVDRHPLKPYLKGPTYRVFVGDEEVLSTGSKARAEAIATTLRTTDSDVRVEESASVVNRVATFDPNEEIRFIEDGKAVRITLNPAGMTRAYNNLWNSNVSEGLRLLNNYNGWLRQFYTQKNPAWFVMNVLRDVPSAMIYATGESGASIAAKIPLNIPQAFKAAWALHHNKSAGAKMDAVLKKYMESGGYTGFAYVGDIESQTIRMKGVLARYTGWDEALREFKGGVGKGVSAVGAKILNTRFFAWIEAFNSTFENMTRIAVFKSAMDSGLTVDQAGQLAKHASTNFNTRGEWGPNINAAWLFANAGIQGTRNVGHALLFSPHKEQVWALMGGLVMLGVMAGLASDDDDDLLDDEFRSRALLFKIGDSQISIPMPYGFGFFSGFGQLLAQVMKHPAKRDQVAMKMASLAFDHFSPFGSPVSGQGDSKDIVNVAPTIAKPVLNAAVNVSPWGGSPLYPDSPFDTTRPDSEKMWASTRGTGYAAVAEWINALTGGDARQSGLVSVSPETLKLSVNTLFGGAGRLVTDLLSLPSSVASGTTSPKNVPIVKNLYRDVDKDAYVQRFYQQAEEAQDAYQIYRNYLKDKNIDAARSYKNEESAYVAMGRVVKTYRSRIKKLRDLEESISASDIPSAQKNARLSSIGEEIIKTAKVFNDKLKSVP